MIDRALRARKERVLRPVVRRLPASLRPSAITGAALVVGLGSALAAALGAPAAALGLWLGNRLLDGLDGTIARRDGGGSDAGAYADMLGDVVVYAAVPLGIAAGAGHRGAWIAAAALLAAFYVNAVGWAYLSALLERRGAGAAATGEMTAVTMPPALIEGAETVLLLGLALALPQWSAQIMGAMAALVAIGAAQRALLARRLLS
ncbi:MAG: CDP-alcohol phosphatidyltransferase family protein [Thermoleophilia bacterium]